MPIACKRLKPKIFTDLRIVHLGEYQDAYDKAKAFVSNLTNAQKISIITGGNVNGTSSWTALANKDGFAGINGQYYVSSFPMGGALAMTWDRDHMEAEANAAGDEFYLMGYNLVSNQGQDCLCDD